MEIALEFFKVVGAYLQDVNKQGFEMCVPHLSVLPLASRLQPWHNPSLHPLLLVHIMLASVVTL